MVLPEVFLKAVSAVRNLGHPLAEFTTVNFDFLQHYRPRVNVVERPHAAVAAGKGYAHHRTSRDDDSAAGGRADRKRAMSPEPPAPDTLAPPDPILVDPQENYPFWGYLDLAGFVIIAVLALIVDSALVGALLSVAHIRKFFVELPAQFLLYAFLLWLLSVMFRRYYGRPFWASLRWISTGLRPSVPLTCGVLRGVWRGGGKRLLKTPPDLNSPMNELLSDKTSAVLIAVFGTTLGPLCEELVFRGFLQPLRCGHSARSRECWVRRCHSGFCTCSNTDIPGATC